MRWFVVFFGSLLAFLVSVFVFNYKVDSLLLFHKERFDALVFALNSGKMIGNFKNMDERLFKKKLLESVEVTPKAIALGSSRIMPLSGSMLGFSSKEFLNLGLSGADLFDHAGMLEVYLKRHKKPPEFVIFCLDPWIFNANNGQTRSNSLKAEYTAWMERVGVDSNPNAINEGVFKKLANSKILKLFSLDYTWQNIESVWKKLRHGASEWQIVEDENAADSIIRNDGSTANPSRLKPPTMAFLEAEAREFARGRVYGLGAFHTLSNLDLFTKTIDFLAKNGTKIVFYLPPYNPLAWDLIEERFLKMKESEEYILEFAKTRKIAVFGSYNPHKMGLKLSDFADALHMLDGVYPSIFNGIFE